MKGSSKGDLLFVQAFSFITGFMLGEIIAWLVRNDFLGRKKIKQRAYRPCAEMLSVFLCSSFSGSFLVFRYVGKISEILTAIKTVADNEMVGNGKERYISLEVHKSA